MKAICPISGVPFRTYDSLPLQWPVEHPIFSIPFEQLVIVLDEIRNQEEKFLENFTKDSLAQVVEAKKAAGISDLTQATNMAMQEKQWNNPAFRLYQTKHLVMLAFMKHASLIEVETGYACRPKPEIVNSHFWLSVELFSWAATLNNEQQINRLPHYRVSKDNEGMENLPEYLEILSGVKNAIGSKYRSFSTEKQLATWEQAIAILTRRREVLKEKLSTSHNPLVAKWALTITNAPKDLWDFWYAILSSPSTKITFEGVKIGDKWEQVTGGDLRELQDWLDDNLVRPKGDVGTYHRDDSEFYFIARQTALDIVRTHILILEQGTSSYRIVNVAIGSEVIGASDEVLNIKAREHGLTEMPSFINYPKKLDYIRALAGWRIATQQKLLEILQPKSEAEKQVELSKEEKGKYEIL